MPTETPRVHSFRLTSSGLPFKFPTDEDHVCYVLLWLYLPRDSTTYVVYLALYMGR